MRGEILWKIGIFLYVVGAVGALAHMVACFAGVHLSMALYGGFIGVALAGTIIAIAGIKKERKERRGRYYEE